MGGMSELTGNIPGNVREGLTIIGLAFLVYKLLSLVRVLASLYILPGVNLSRFLSKDGERNWAIVTGASDGLGREYALQLARRGFNILLVSRTQEKLESVASEIKANFPRLETRLIAIDFSQPYSPCDNNSVQWDNLDKLIQTLRISILVNNVGLSHVMPVAFTDTDPREMRSIIDVNCHSTLRITRMVVPGMIEQKSGLILTMASFAGGVFPTPLLATYAGSKAFLTAWSASLAAELEPYGITVHCIQSHLVVSNMSKLRRASLLVPTAKAFVSSALSRVGRSGGCQDIPYTGTPYWSHAMLQWSIHSTLGRFSRTILGVNLRMHQDIRKRALRKQKREAMKQNELKTQ